MKPTIQEVIDKLAAVGSPDQVALELEAQGIQGQRSKSRSCAIAEFLTRETGESVSVGRYRVFAGRESIPHNHENIAQFIWAFDRGQYPNLIKGRRNGAE